MKRSFTLSVGRGSQAGLAKAEILRRLGAMIDLLQLQNHEVSFVLTDDETIHELNRIYRHKDRPTDVLAFAMREGDFAELAGSALGDVYVSVPTARKQALEHGVEVLEEVTMLLAHGLLHLLGWDHETVAKDRRMRAETDRLCAAARSGRRSAAGKRLAKAGANAASKRSKAGADRPSSRNLSSRKPARSSPKVQGPHEVKARRSRKR